MNINNYNYNQVLRRSKSIHLTARHWLNQLGQATSGTDPDILFLFKVIKEY